MTFLRRPNGSRPSRGALKTVSSAWGTELHCALARDGLLRTVVVVYAVALILYLPLETALISGLPPTAYWILRLLPDALVAALALATVALGDRRARTMPVRILWALGAVCLILTVANSLRGISLYDSVNAIRLVVRYLILGLLVWWASMGQASLAPLVVPAVLGSGLVQIAIVAVQVVQRIADSLGRATGFDSSSLLFVDGSTGRYDRLGLLLMSVAIAAFATTDRITRSRISIVAACVAILYLSTSRQAALGMAIAFGLLALVPSVSSRYRGLAAGLAALSIVLVVATPGQATPAPSDESDLTLGPPATAAPLATPTVLPSAAPLAPPTPPVVPATKDEIRLTLDPNRNFRLFYNLVVTPWAAVTEPVIGFGPRQQLAEHPDPRLAAQFESAGMSWSWARRFTNDSNYATLVIQFGVVASLLFLLLTVSLIVRAARVAIRNASTFARFAVANSAAVLVAAWFGPAFEMRMVSIILWVSVMGAIATVRPPRARPFS